MVMAVHLHISTRAYEHPLMPLHDYPLALYLDGSSSRFHLRPGANDREGSRISPGRRTAPHLRKPFLETMGFTVQLEFDFPHHNRSGELIERVHNRLGEVLRRLYLERAVRHVRLPGPLGTAQNPPGPGALRWVHSSVERRLRRVSASGSSKALLNPGCSWGSGALPQ